MRPSGAQRGTGVVEGAAAGALRRGAAGSRRSSSHRLVRPLLALHVGLALHEGEHAAVGGDLRVADALQAHQVLDGEGRRRRGAAVAARRGTGEQPDRRGQVIGTHGGWRFLRSSMRREEF